MIAIWVYPGTETPRLMSRTSNVRKGKWDLVRGNHQGQRQLPRDQQAGHKTLAKRRRSPYNGRSSCLL